MKAAVQIKLPLKQDEISGVAYYPVDSSILAINDQKERLNKIKKGRQNQCWKFSQGTDFEDVVLLYTTFYVLHYNGNIMRLTFGLQHSVSVRQYYFNQPGESKNEFEILYHHPDILYFSYNKK